MEEIQRRRETNRPVVQWYSSGLTMSGQLMSSMAGVFKHVLRKRVEIYKIICIEHAKENRIRENRESQIKLFMCL